MLSVGVASRKAAKAKKVFPACYKKKEPEKGKNDGVLETIGGFNYVLDPKK